MLLGMARADVRLDQKPPVIGHRTFGPAYPPPDMLPLTGAEAAITESKFDCQVGMKYQLVGHKRSNDGSVATFAVQSVQVTLQLNVVIWLPIGARPKLAAHEEGHRRIAEQVDADAQRVARSAAESVDGKNVSGQGTNCSRADKDAADSSAHQFFKAYLERSFDVAERVRDT